MTKEDLRKLVNRPFWSKDVVLWIGPDATVDELAAGVPCRTLDLLDLFSPTEDVPAGDTERGELLRQRLDAKLQELRQSDGGRVVLKVQSAPLLARYRAGLRPFFDWFAGSTRMVVLVLPPSPNVPSLPAYLAGDLKLDEAAAAKYLISCLANDPSKVFREESR